MKQEMDDLKKRAEELVNALRSFEKDWRYIEERTSRRSLSVDEHTDYVSLNGIADICDQLRYKIEAMKKPVLTQGVLVKNQSGRYELNGHELTSGSAVDVFVEYYDDDNGYFLSTRIEHNGMDYYAVALGEDQALDGVRARLRG